MKHAYKKGAAVNTVEVSFGCDPLEKNVQSITVERAGGHGGTLEVWRLVRTPRSNHYALFGVAVQQYYGTHSPIDQIMTARARLPTSEVDKRLESVRPALTARFRELIGDDELGMGGFMSSANFHLMIGLQDAAGSKLMRGFTGYENSDNQAKYLGLQLAMQRLAPLLNRKLLRSDSISDEHRRFVTQHARAAWRRLDPEDGWFVRRRLVHLVGRSGTLHAVPIVVDALRVGIVTARKKKSGHAKDALRQPLRALAYLTGWDATQSDQGDPLDPLKAAERAVQECTRQITSDPLNATATSPGVTK